MLIDILPIVRAGPVSVTFLFEIRPLLGNTDTIYRLLAAAETPSSLAGSERVERLVRTSAESPARPTNALCFWM
jgi:hypothetical protein